jgi:predicted HTH transcriptional regulator
MNSRFDCRLPSYIRKLLEQGEGLQLEFKKEINDEYKIARTLVSFSNTLGGRLLVGVNDDCHITGVKAEEETHVLLQAAARYCRPPVEPVVKEYLLGKRSLLEVLIPPGEHKPYFALGEDKRWWAYVRVGNQSLLASKVMLEVMRQESQQQELLIRYTDAEHWLLNYLKEHPRITLKEYCRLANISPRRARKIMVNMVRAGLLQIHLTEKEDFYTSN